MDFDVLFTILFWAAGLCGLFWAGLLLAGLIGDVMEDRSFQHEAGEELNDSNVESSLCEVYRARPGPVR